MRPIIAAFYMLLAAVLFVVDAARSMPAPQLATAASATAAAEAERRVEPLAPVFVEQILTALQLDVEFAGVADHAKSELAGLPDGVRAPAVAVIGAAFDPELLRADVAAEFVARFDRRHALEAARWLRTGVGRRTSAGLRRVAALESPWTFDAVRSNRDAFEERVMLLDRIDALVGVSGRTERRARRAASAMLQSAAAMEPAALRAASEAVSARPGHPVAGPGVLDLHETFAAVATPDLREYAAFLETDSGRWLTSTLEQGILEALDAAGARAGAGLVTAFSSL